MGVVGNVGNENMQSCIDVCVKCTQACEECLTLCLEEEDAARVKCIKTLQDCIDICCLATKFLVGFFCIKKYQKLKTESPKDAVT